MPMAVDTVGRVTFRVAICAYAAALAFWLLLGLLPVAADHVAAVHHTLATAAGHDSAFGRLAARVLHPDTMADMTTGAQTFVAYLFSVLNLALGLLLVIRRPDQTVPRLLGFALLGTAATFNLPSHRAFRITGSPWPIATAHFAFHIISGVSYIWAVVLFPDGRLPRQLRMGPRATAASAVVFTAAVALVCWRSSFLAHPQFFVVFFGVAVPAFGVGAQMLRLRERHTSTMARRTARMLCAALLPAFVAAVLWGLARLVGATSGPAGRAAATFAARVTTWFPVVFAVVPVVLFAAVLRYRLWDLDRWLTGVLVYGLITVLIGAGYVLAVALGGALAGEGPLWTLVMALSVAAAVAEPLRTRARRWANRVVFGVSLSPQEALRTLSDGLLQLTPTGELDQLVAVTVQATRATSATLWLVDGASLVLAASAPLAQVDASQVEAAQVEAAEVESAQLEAAQLEAAQGDAGGSGQVLAQALGAGWCSGIGHQGQLLGVLAVTAPDGTDFPPRDRELIADIAAHAGLVVHNAVLTVGLARQADQRAALSRRLHVARRRLIAAQDAERRRLERNLHDGAQQALVATLMGVRSIDPGRADVPDRIIALRRVIAIARDSLVEVMRAAYPAVLDELGMVGAIQRAAELTRRLGVDVTVSADLGTEIIDADVAVAVYFCCLEGLQNVIKYAGASAVVVELTESEGELSFAVTDDGAGFEVAQLTEAGGLRQLDARLATIGGTLTVQTRPGGGTRIAGRVSTRARVGVQ